MPPTKQTHNEAIPTDATPANIKEFNEISGAILSVLYNSHPRPKKFDPSEIAQLIGVSYNDVLPSGQSFANTFGHTILWLGSEGVINLVSTVAPFRATLAAKTFATLTASVGSELADAAAKGSSQAGKLAELAGNFFGAFTGSIFKALSSS